MVTLLSTTVIEQIYEQKQFTRGITGPVDAPMDGFSVQDYCYTPHKSDMTKNLILLVTYA